MGFATGGAGEMMLKSHEFSNSLAKINQPLT
jgi:hypothetical protein